MKYKDFLLLSIFSLLLFLSFVINDKNFLISLAGKIFSTAGILIFTGQILYNRSYLKLTRYGVKEKTLFYQKEFNWNDIGDFRLTGNYLNKQLSYTFTDKYCTKKWGQNLSDFSYKKNGSFQCSYKVKPEELLELFVEYKANAVAQKFR
jgi:hypothetical protein